MHADLQPPAWALCLSAFERELTPQQFATWIRPLSCAEEGGTLKLRAPNRFILQCSDFSSDRMGKPLAKWSIKPSCLEPASRGRR